MEKHDPEAIFEEQLKKCGVDYFDFYLLHNVNESSMSTYLDKEIDSFYKVTDGIQQRLFNIFLDTDILNNYLTVQKDNDFSYYNIYKNLEVVEHPPLYFILLHTISSFDAGNFSKWHAGILNFILFILIYIMLFKLAKQLLKDEKMALCAVALWGFSEIGIDTAIFLRMYILQTLLSICLVYETLKILDKNSSIIPKINIVSP